MTDVLAADSYHTNADLIVAAARLGYIGGHVLDLSYGRGIFWQKHRPTLLVTSDGNRALDTDRHIDVRDAIADAYSIGVFDTVVWDGPYRLNGTPDQGDFDSRYGIEEATSWRDRMEVLTQGVRHAVAYTRRGGTILIKCQDQVVSGHKVWQTFALAAVGESRGCRLVDQLHMVNAPRPQPPGRRQVHSRSNYSTLLVMRKSA